MSARSMAIPASATTTCRPSIAFLIFLVARSWLRSRKEAMRPYQSLRPLDLRSSRAQTAREANSLRDARRASVAPRLLSDRTMDGLAEFLTTQAQRLAHREQVLRELDH